MKHIESESLDQKPPPIPRRPNSAIPNYLHSAGGYSSYGNMYGNPHQSMMYSSPGFGSYGNYGTRGAYGSDSVSAGVEDVTNTAFQSIGSVIQAFSSVSMMLESTLFATQNSVRAIASVADQFRHLRLHLMTSSMSFLRTLRYYIRKFLILFRVRRYSDEQSMEDAFYNSSTQADNKNWAIILFYAVVFATPIIVWKILRGVVADQEPSSEWHQGVGEHFLAEVKYDFFAENNDELSINTHDIIRIAPKHKQPKIRGWILASDGEKQGIVPASYIKILGKNRSRSPKKITLPDANTLAEVAPAAREVTNEPLSEDLLTKVYEEHRIQPS